MSCLNCFKKPITMDVVKIPVTFKDIKKVSFNNTVKVVYFEPTAVESNVCWQQVARDRLRFKRRILDVEQRIGWVFANSHRELLYKMIYPVNILPLFC